jgi:hypothetical protein
MTGIRDEEQFGLKEHWKVLLAMSLVSISTFQYGLDFGIIGGLQAMVGFLKVRVGNPTLAVGYIADFG